MLNLITAINYVKRVRKTNLILGAVFINEEGHEFFDVTFLDCWGRVWSMQVWQLEDGQLYGED
jgi:hypothetical protein